MKALEGQRSKIMKKIISLLALLSFILSASAVYSKDVNDWERKMYYEVTDRVYQLPKNYSKEQYQSLIRSFAEENGLSYSEMMDIIDRVWDQYLTDREFKIIEDLYDEMSYLPKDAPDAAYDKVYHKIASKYGVSVYTLYDIEERDWLGW